MPLLYLIYTTLAAIIARWPLVEKLIADDKEALTMFSEATTGKHGRDHSKSDNITLAHRVRAPATALPMVALILNDLM